jgi:hypothetical protein
MKEIKITVTIIRETTICGKISVLDKSILNWFSKKQFGAFKAKVLK